MTWAFPLSVTILLAILALSAYADRIYFEMGKFLAREYAENIDALMVKEAAVLGGKDRVHYQRGQVIVAERHSQPRLHRGIIRQYFGL